MYAYILYHILPTFVISVNIFLFSLIILTNLFSNSVIYPTLFLQIVTLLLVIFNTANMRISNKGIPYQLRA
ncbi:hypothetical protein LguiB_013581 [Lonicera macranthoides]